jgi:hypothetical protein
VLAKFKTLVDTFDPHRFDSWIASRSLRCSSLAALNCLTNSWVSRRVALKAAALASTEPNSCCCIPLVCTQRSISSENAMTGLRQLSETRCTGSPSRSHLRALLGVRCKHSAISFHPFRSLISMNLFPAGRDVLSCPFRGQKDLAILNRN